MHGRCQLNDCAGFPQVFTILGRRFGAFKVFLGVGLYVGVVVSVFMADRAGVPPLRMGTAVLSVIVVGLLGSRLYYVMTSPRSASKEPFWVQVRRTGEGGAGILGSLVVIPFSVVPVQWAGVPLAAFWDYLIVGVFLGAVFVRFGCVCHGCCGGRESQAWFAVCQHDVRGVFKRRVPVQWLEIASWVLGAGLLLALWPRHFKPGSYALGGLAWYGLVRFWLEPLRENPGSAERRTKFNRILAGGLAVAAGGLLLVQWWRWLMSSPPGRAGNRADFQAAKEPDDGIGYNWKGSLRAFPSTHSRRPCPIL